MRYIDHNRGEDEDLFETIPWNSQFTYIIVTDFRASFPYKNKFFSLNLYVAMIVLSTKI